MRRPKMLTTAALFLTLGLTIVADEPGDDARRHDFNYYTFDAVPGATATTAWGNNSRGDIVGSYTKDGVTHGFLLSDGVLTTIDYEGAASTEARGINAQGDIVGLYRIAGEPSMNAHGTLRDKHGQMAPVNVPDHTTPHPQTITSSGVLVGCRHDTDQTATMRGVINDAHDLREDGDVDEYGEIDAFASINNGASPDGQLNVGFFMDMMM